MPKTYVETLLGDNEQILLITRAHVFVLLRAALKEIIYTVIILLVFLIAGIGLAATPLGPFVPLILGLLLFPVAGMAIDFLVWNSREYIITNFRVIQVSGVINKNVIDSSLEKVNDVKLTQSVLGRMFDYGDVEILTASELGVNLFRRIAVPVRFKTVMLNAKERLERGPAPGTQAGGSPADIPAMIAQLDQLRQRGILTEAEFQQKKAELLAKL